MDGWTATSTVEPSQDCDQGEPWLPPGFRFHPTDEELVTFYLASKIQNANFSDRAITDADLNKSEPWELPGKAKMGEKEWYFYSSRDRKYPTGMRTNRATRAGYWKATGKDRDVISSRTGKLVGMKKTLVFYKGRAPKGLKTNWVMHEYRAEDIIPPTPRTKLPVGVDAKDEWVVCRIFHKSAGGKKMALADLQRCNALTGGGASHVDARIARIAATLPALMELPLNTTATFSAALPSPHLPVLAPPSNVHLANLLKSLPAPGASTSMNAFAATPDYAGLDNSVVKALYQHYSSTVNAMSTLHPAIKREPSRAVDVSSYTSAGFPNYSPAQFNTHLPPLLQDHGQLINGNNRNQLPSPRHMLQEQHNQTARMQPMMSVNANHFTPEAISDSCATEYVLHPNVIHPTQFPRFASDLENLWLYAESEPIINRFRLPNH